ncbi:MAG: hypothetical protein WCO02_16575 [Bacteroidota bacterium]
MSRSKGSEQTESGKFQQKAALDRIKKPGLLGSWLIDVADL